MRAGKIVALVVGILMVLVALALIVPGGVLLGIYGSQRDSTGFFETSSRSLISTGHALVTPDVELDMGPLVGDWLPTGDRAALRVRATAGADGSAFVGIGPSDKVAEYLDGVEYDEVTDFGWAWEQVKYRHIDGQAPSSPPTDQDFWVAQDSGPGSRTVDWDVVDGSWTAVVMNADATAPVDVAVSLGARFDILLPIGIGMVVAGVILLGVAIILIVLGARRPPAPPLVQGQTAQPPAGV